MIIVSTRASFARMVSEFLATPPLGVPRASGPFCCGELMDAETHVPANRDGLLTLDLGSVQCHRDLDDFISDWRTCWPTTGIVLVAPGILAGEASLVARLGKGAEVLCSPEHALPESWHRIITAGVTGPLLASIWGDLCTIARDLERPIPYERQVLTLLEACPGVRDIKQYTRHDGPERRKLKSRLRRAVDSRTRNLIYGLRLLWAIRLREEGWSPWDVARFLSYEDSSHAARKLRLFWRIGMRDLERISYQSAAEELVDWITGTKKILARLGSLEDLRKRILKLPRATSSPSLSSSALGA